MHTRGHPYKLFKSQSNTRVRSTFLANELSMLGTIYHVTLLTSQVSMHSEVVLYVWTSVITSCVTDNFYTFYRAMHFSAKRGIEIAYRLSVRP